MAGGRPGIYTVELAEIICEQIATSAKSMKTICEELGMRVATVLTWLSEGHRSYNVEFAKMYARAKQLQADYLQEDMLEVADTPLIGRKVKTDAEGAEEITVGDNVDRSRLMVDARKWAAAKLAPKKYGDRVELQHTTDGDNRPPWLSLAPTKPEGDAGPNE